jgi:hypothetical protein
MGGLRRQQGLAEAGMGQEKVWTDLAWQQRLAHAIFACARCSTPTSNCCSPLTQAESDPCHKGGIDCQPQAWGRLSLSV